MNDYKTFLLGDDDIDEYDFAGTDTAVLWESLEITVRDKEDTKLIDIFGKDPRELLDDEMGWEENEIR